MKKGFTLAEVLITLGIIGIVAALTIPTLMNNIQDNEFKNKLRKEYSVINEAYQLLKTDNGGTFEDAIASQGCAGASTTTANTCYKNVYKQRLSYIRECDGGGNIGVCFPSRANIKWLNGTNISSSVYLGDASAGLVLKDGSTLSFNMDNASCQSGLSPNYTNRCGWITLDVNGLNPPNTWGRDIYVFFVFSDVIRPSAIGVIDSSVTSSDDCNTGLNRGYTCSRKYLLGN